LYVSKKEVEKLATKDEVQKLATKDEVQKLATKEEVNEVKELLQQMKEDSRKRTWSSCFGFTKKDSKKQKKSRE